MERISTTITVQYKKTFINEIFKKAGAPFARVLLNRKMDRKKPGYFATI